MKKSLKRNYIYNVLYQLLGIIVPLITTPYVSRVLQADGLGEYSFAYSITMYFVVFGKLGIDIYGQLKVAESRNSLSNLTNTFIEIFMARTLTMLCSSALYMVFPMSDPRYRTMYTVLLVYISAQMVDIAWFYQGLEEFGNIVLRNAVIKIISAVLVFRFVREKSDLYLYVFIIQGAVLLGNIALWLGLNRFIKASTIETQGIKKRIRNHWKNSMVYFIPTMATSVYTILDKSMIGWITRSDLENGLYDQAHKIETMLITIITSISTVTLPRLKYMHSEGAFHEIKNIIDKSIGFVLFLSMPMFIGIWTVADRLIPWFLGSGYEKCIGLLRIFSVLMVVVGLDNIIGKQCLMAMNRQRQYNIGVITGALVNVVMNLLLIPRFLSMGAAVASVASELAVLSIFVYYSKDQLDIYGIGKDVIRYFSMSLGMGLCVAYLGRFIQGNFVGLILQASVGCVVYLLLLLLAKDKFLFKVLFRK